MTTATPSLNLSVSLESRRTSPLRLSAPFSQEWQRIIVVALAGAVALLPIVIWGIPSGSDLNNHYRFAIEFHDSIRRGKLYPGWLSTSNFGYGDARLRFYPPGLYYLLSAARIFTGWYYATILTLSLLSVVGGLGVYFWSRSLGQTRNAMWAGIIYTVAPYHLNQIYRASMLAEYAGCSVLPFAFAFVDRVCRKGKAADVAGLSLAFALLILVHLPLTLIGSVSLVVYAAFRINKELFWQTLLKLALAAGTSLAATAFFWSTILAELPWIKGSTVEPNIYYDYRVNFLFSASNLTNFGAWYINLLAFVTVALLLPALILIKRRLFSKRGGPALGAVFLLAVISLLMATEVSRPVWAIIPKLRDVQFPWRWLGITSMCGSILLAASLSKWVDRLRSRFRPRDLAVGFALALAVFFVTYQVVWDAEYLQGEQFTSKFPHVPGALSYKEWQPVWAKDLSHMKKMNSAVEADSREVTITSWERERRTFKIGRGPGEDARVLTYYYPLWTATSQGQALNIRPAEDGAILITIPPAEATVEVVFREPRRVEIVRAVSGFGWLMIATLFAFGPYKEWRFRLRSKQSLMNA
ncbi:MAG TPA: 6-pyruvoyl-tetrahydropterin synthase-related protein [Pyrinomonadaceae bacterium]|nr:6-pyruvoyl-tetrahydropterin synthase-related protein [Pyrinomonadaceae bacterium]